MKPPGGHHNTRGRYYEVLFKAECLKRGLLVLSPECSHLPFDVAIFSNGKFLRIQIKGTGVLREKYRKGCGTDRYYTFNSKTSCGKSYLELGIDFIAAYIEPLNSWYIIPAFMATAAMFQIRPGSTGKASDCKDRWDLLGAV